jgi:gp16 family phage-associated protein
MKTDLQRIQKVRAIKARLARQGVTVRQWAKQQGFQETMVYMLLNGQLKGCYGKSHQVAVALGLKPAPEAAGNHPET